MLCSYADDISFCVLTSRILVFLFILNRMCSSSSATVVVILYTFFNFLNAFNLEDFD
jgi:hypothetical protein